MTLTERLVKGPVLLAALAVMMTVIGATHAEARQCVRFIGVERYTDPTDSLFSPALFSNPIGAGGLVTTRVSVSWYRGQDVNFVSDSIGEVVNVSAVNNASPLKTDQFNVQEGGLSCSSSQFDDEIAVIKAEPHPFLDAIANLGTTLAVGSVGAACAPCGVALGVAAQAGAEFVEGGPAAASGLSLTYDMRFETRDGLEIVAVAVPGHFRELEFHPVTQGLIPLNPNLKDESVVEGAGMDFYHVPATDAMRERFDQTNNLKYTGPGLYRTVPAVTYDGCMSLCMQRSACQGFNYYASALPGSESNSFGSAFVCELHSASVAAGSPDIGSCTRPGQVTRSEVVSYTRLKPSFTGITGCPG